MSIFGDILGIGTNLFNYGLQKEQFEYQKKLQQEIFKREDNAVQRRVADLEAAGLSPMLAAGSAANAGQAISVNAPQMGKSDLDILSAISGIKNIEMTDAQIALNEAQKKGSEWNLDYAKKNNLPYGQGQGNVSISLPGGFHVSAPVAIAQRIYNQWRGEDDNSTPVPHIPSYDDYKDWPSSNYVAEYVGY